MSSIVHSKQTASGNQATLTIPKPTPGNILHMMFTQGVASAEPVGGGDNSGSGTWKAGTAHAQGANANVKGYYYSKEANGSETILEPKPGAGASILGIVYWEVKAGSQTVVSIAHHDNITTTTEPSLEGLNTGAETNCIVLAAVLCNIANTGAPKEWLGTGPKLSLPEEAASSRVMGGGVVSTVAVKATDTLTAKYTTTGACAMLAVAIKAGGEQPPLTVAQGQSSLLSRVVSYLRTLTVTQTQNAIAGKLLPKVLPLVTQGQSATVSAKSGKQGELEQPQAASMTYTVTPQARVASGAQSVARSALVDARRTATQPQTAFKPIAAKPKTIPTVAQPQVAASGGLADRHKNTSNKQIATRASTVVASHIISTFNELVARVNKLQTRTIPTVSQPQVARAGKTRTLSLFVAQAQAAILTKLKMAAPIHAYGAEQQDTHAYGGDA